MSKALLAFLTVVNLLNYLDRYLVAAVLPVLAKELSLNDEGSGQLVSAFVFGYFLFSPFFGYLGDRYSRPRLMALGVFIWSVASLSCAWATSFTLFVIARVVVGIGEASYGTIAPGYIKDHIPDPEKLNKALAMFFSAIPVGAALGYVVGGAFTKHWGWHSAFIFGGALGFIFVPVLLRLGDSRTATAEGISFSAGLKELAQIRALWFAICGYALNAFALNGVAAFISKLGVKNGFELDEINFAFGIILVVTGFAGTLIGGNMSSRLAARSKDSLASMFRFVAISAFLGAPFLALAFAEKNHTLFLMYCALAEFFVFLGVAAINAIIVIASPGRLVTLSQGVTIFALNLFGALLAPIAVGKLSDASSLEQGLQLCTAALAGAGIIWYAGAIRRGGNSLQNG